MTVVMRVQGDPSHFFADVRRTIRDMHQDLAIVDLRTIDDVLDSIGEQRRIPATAFGLVGLLGLLLSAVGLYGVVAYGVRERARELGIRLALGARPADVRRLVLRQGFTIVGIGLAIGAVATVAIAQVLRRTLFGVGSADPTTLAAVCGVLMAAGFAALYLPARWASASSLRRRFAASEARREAARTRQRARSSARALVEASESRRWASVIFGFSRSAAS